MKNKETIVFAPSKTKAIHLSKILMRYQLRAFKLPYIQLNDYVVDCKCGESKAVRLSCEGYNVIVGICKQCAKNRITL